MCNHRHLLSDSNPTAFFSFHKVLLKQRVCDQCTNGLKIARKIRGRKEKDFFDHKGTIYSLGDI